MIIRSAVLEGVVAEADRGRFDSYMRETAAMAIGRYPGIRAVKLRRPVEREDGAPEVYMIFDLYFDDLKAMRAALASPVRAAVRAALGEVMPMLRGRFYHLVMEEG